MLNAVLFCFVEMKVGRSRHVLHIVKSFLYIIILCLEQNNIKVNPRKVVYMTFATRYDCQRYLDNDIL